MKHIQLIVAQQGEVMLDGRWGQVRPTASALSQVVADQPRVPITRGHGGPQCGTVTGWKVASIEGTQTLLADATFEDHVPIAVGQAVSLEAVLDTSRLAESGEFVVNAWSIDAVALLPLGKRGAFKSAQVRSIVNSKDMTHAQRTATRQTEQAAPPAGDIGIRPYTEATFSGRVTEIN